MSSDTYNSKEPRKTLDAIEEADLIAEIRRQLKTAIAVELAKKIAIAHTLTASNDLSKPVSGDLSKPSNYEAQLEQIWKSMFASSKIIFSENNIDFNPDEPFSISTPQNPTKQLTAGNILAMLIQESEDRYLQDRERTQLLTDDILYPNFEIFQSNISKLKYTFDSRRYRN